MCLCDCFTAPYVLSTSEQFRGAEKEYHSQVKASACTWPSLSLTSAFPSSLLHRIARFHCSSPLTKFLPFRILPPSTVPPSLPPLSLASTLALFHPSLLAHLVPLSRRGVQVADAEQLPRRTDALKFDSCAFVPVNLHKPSGLYFTHIKRQFHKSRGYCVHTKRLLRVSRVSDSFSSTAPRHVHECLCTFTKSSSCQRLQSGLPPSLPPSLPHFLSPSPPPPFSLPSTLSPPPHSVQTHTRMHAHLHEVSAQQADLHSSGPCTY
jgi:hypothetical protein